MHQLRRSQLLNTTLDEVWEFISSPQNLKKITPDYMGFDITTPDSDQPMYPGMIISYQVSPLLGIKQNWVTEITHVQDRKFFVDEQRIGPYKLWHHQHHIEETVDGILMTDIVTYAVPFGVLGRLMHSLVIRKKLQEIFDFRHQKLEELFNYSKNI